MVNKLSDEDKKLKEERLANEKYNVVHRRLLRHQKKYLDIVNKYKDRVKISDYSVNF